LGRTLVRVSGPGEVKEYVRVEDVERDLSRYLERIDIGSLDAVTFSGSGEPTLNPDLGKMVEVVRSLVGGRVPLVLLTNASLLYRDDVRRNVAGFDIVTAKLDGGDEETYHIINRPVKGMPSLETIIASIKKVKDEIEGKLMTQTMFLHTTYGFTNCDGERLENLIDVLLDIDPYVIQLDTPYRPGGEGFVRPATVEELKGIGERFKDRMGRKIAEKRLWIFGEHDMRGRKTSWRRHRPLQDEAMDLLKRRPCRAVDIADSLAISYQEASTLLGDLLRKGLVKETISEGERYYRPSSV